MPIFPSVCVLSLIPNTHLLGRCRVKLDDEWVRAIEPLNSPWEIDPTPIPLRILTLSPDVNPAIRKPTSFDDPI